MKCATQIDRKNKCKWIIVCILLVMLLVVLSATIIYSIRETDIQTEEKEYLGQEEEDRRDEQAIEMEAYFKELESEYIEFEKLFRENKYEMQQFMEVTDESVLREEESLILFNKKSYLDMQSGSRSRECITILFDNDSFTVNGNEIVEKNLNENLDLIEVLDFIKEKGVITSIGLYCIYENIQVVYFTVNTDFTPFITTNNGITNYFAWCNNKDCEIYGYRNIEDNWYMLIEAPPE